MAVLSENRFILGLGAGERLNEHVVGEGWPGIGERHERLSEAYDIIRGLLDGSIENYRGKYFTLDDAKLYDRPERTPAIIGAAGGPEAARLAGRKADGMITTVPQAGLIEAFAPAARGRCTARCRCATRRAWTGHARSRIAIIAGRWPAAR